jgi:Rrf2 family protein
MANILKFSDAATLALHTMAFLARSPRRTVTVREIAKFLGASQAHLSKVLQRLAKTGLVKSLRGPAGGFELARPADKVTLLAVFETIEGPLDVNPCLLGERKCKGNGCILGDLPQKVNRRIKEYLSNTRLSMLTGFLKGVKNR